MKKLLALLILATVPISPLSWAAPDGEELYRRHCESCHGGKGGGGVGVPLDLPGVQALYDDEFLAKTIRLGRSGRVMPAFPHLSDAQIQALIKHIRRFTPGVKPVSIDPSPVVGDVQHGETLYAKHCASCHGSRGEGGKGTGVTFSRPRDFPIIPTGLNNPGFLQASSDQRIRHILRDGIAGTPMQSFLKQGLSEQDIDDLTAYVRSFEKLSATPQKTDTGKAQNLLVMESSYNMEETLKNIKAAIVGMNFRVIRIQPLEQGLVEAGKENSTMLIVYFCNFDLLNKALSIDPRIGLFLPCRFTLLEKDGKVQVIAVNPSRLSRLFNNAELIKVCEELLAVYTDIMENATL